MYVLTAPNTKLTSTQQDCEKTEKKTDEKSLESLQKSFQGDKSKSVFGYVHEERHICSEFFIKISREFVKELIFCNVA